ncbi:MAG: glycosyltransferase family 4 protein [Rugosibacter sp.]|nr:glycosyltransferase family 4 protein [Rugosibacter sp.]
MKILYHHRTASKDGQAVHIEEMINAMRAQGHEVRVVSPAPDHASHAGQMGNKVSWVHRLRNVLPKALYELLELAYSLVAYRRLARMARDFQPDVIYERYNLYLLAGVMLKRRQGIPLLLEVNAPLVFERSQHSGGLALPRLARWAEGLAWRSADYVLPVTHVLASHVKAYGVPDTRIAVIANGINRAHFAVSPAPTFAKEQHGLVGKLVLGFTGFVREWHGVDRVVRWMATPAAPSHLHLVIVGDGPVRADLEALAKQLDISDRVRFTGVIHRDKVPDWVSAFDIALQPAVVPYASPLKLMEYLVLGKAIIAPRTPNLLEVLTDGENALMFDAEEPMGFEQALSRLCTDELLRQKLGAGAHATIAKLDLTWDGNAQRVVNLARQAITASAAAR